MKITWHHAAQRLAAMFDATAEEEHATERVAILMNEGEPGRPEVKPSHLLTVMEQQGRVEHTAPWPYNQPGREKPADVTTCPACGRTHYGWSRHCQRCRASVTLDPV